MPKYDYRCKDCDSVFEINHSMSDSKVGEPCSKCSGILEKSFSSYLLNKLYKDTPTDELPQDCLPVKQAIKEANQSLNKTKKALNDYRDK